MMVVQTRPLAEITQEAVKILFQNLGIVNTVRFINQFTIGYGNYTEERDEIFGDKSIDEIIRNIKQDRGEIGEA